MSDRMFFSTLAKCDATEIKWIVMLSSLSSGPFLLITYQKCQRARAETIIQMHTTPSTKDEKARIQSKWEK